MRCPVAQEVLILNITFRTGRNTLPAAVGPDQMNAFELKSLLKSCLSRSPPFQVFRLQHLESGPTVFGEDLPTLKRSDAHLMMLIELFRNRGVTEKAFM